MADKKNKDSGGGVRTRALVLGIGMPSLVGVVALVLVWQMLPQVPNPVAVHWGLNGAPDGFGSPYTYMVLIALLGWALPVVMAVPWSHTPNAQPSRFMVAVAVWLSIFISFISVGSVMVQRGLASADGAPGVGPIILLALPTAIVGALVPYFLLPKPVWAETGKKVEPLSLAPGQTVAWTSQAKMGRWFLILMSGLAVALAVGALFAAPWYLLGTSAFLGLMLVGFSVFRVSVGQRGLIVRGYLGFPSMRAPLDRIVGVELVQVSPMQEWGGWGWRFRPGGEAIVTRSGPAIQATLTGGGVMVVTAEDAAVGAATLAALVDRHALAE